jgi:putative membrane protein
MVDTDSDGRTKESVLHGALILIAGILSPIYAGCSLLQETLPGVTLSDSNVMSVLDSLDASEIDAAEMARHKAVSPEVQAFAGRVLNEHRQLDEADARLAETLGLQPQGSLLASQLREAHQAAMQALRGTSGPAFDRAYVAYEISRHVRALNFVEAAADTETTPELKQQLVRIGPDLLSHISAARALERHLGTEPPKAVAVR